VPLAHAAKGDGSSRRERHHEVRRVTLVGAGVDLALGIGKLAAGYVAQSQALIADGVHSLSDLLTDAIVIFASREANREADAEHPYGHARIETAGTVGLAISLLLVATGVGFDAVRRLFDPDLLLRPTVLALWVALGSVVVKEALYHYTMRSARRLRSELLAANAWHSRSDAVSSLVVIAGVGGALAGLPYVDAVAAVVVAALIARIGIRLAWSSVGELIDTGLDRARVDAISSAILEVDGVAALHTLRTRRMAGKALVDVHILLRDPRLSVSEGHQISEIVRARLIERIEEVSDVMVHIDPEDDEVEHATMGLPLRKSALSALYRLWEEVPESTRIEEIRLHYLNGQINPEIILPVSLVREADTLRTRFNAPLAAADHFGTVSLLFR